MLAVIVKTSLRWWALRHAFISFIYRRPPSGAAASNQLCQKALASKTGQQRYQVLPMSCGLQRWKVLKSKWCCWLNSNYTLPNFTLLSLGLAIAKHLQSFSLPLQAKQLHQIERSLNWGSKSLGFRDWLKAFAPSGSSKAMGPDWGDQLVKKFWTWSISSKQFKATESLSQRSLSMRKKFFPFLCKRHVSEQNLHWNAQEENQKWTAYIWNNLHPPRNGPRMGGKDLFCRSSKTSECQRLS